VSVRAVKRVIKEAFASSWGFRLFGPLLRAPGVAVLTYHRILGDDRSLSGLPVESFAAQMRWLREHCRPISADALVEQASASHPAKPAVLVTFDDGYRDYHDHAYPVLKELGIPALVFLATSFIDHGGMLWTDAIQWAALSTRRDRVKLPWSDASPTALPNARARAELGERARAHLKTLPDAARRAALEALLAELGDPPRRERLMLNWDEVRRTMDLTQFGGHTHTHPILSRLSREQAETEIRTCRDRIAAETGQTPTTFAYPNGRPADYTPETQAILKRHGFGLVFTTTRGLAGPTSDWMAIRRLPGEAENLPDFVWLSAGLSHS
jgi:peptidoglycan/xylan/chitin deacetylase (PgdA/CDA1 family)